MQTGLVRAERWGLMGVSGVVRGWRRRVQDLLFAVTKRSRRFPASAPGGE